MPNQEGPALTLDRALWYGKMCREHSASTAAETSAQFLKRLQKSQTKKSPTFLCLRTGGLIQDVSWEEDSALLGEFSTRSFLEYHNGGVESRLSQILQGGQLRKYYLSAKACQGILNRAKRRGKELPEMLRIALEQQANVSTDGMCKANTFSLKTESQNVCGQEMQDTEAVNPMSCNTQMQSASLNEPDALGGGKGILIQDDQTGTLSTVNNQSVCYPINTMVASRGNEESRTTFGVGNDGDAQFTLSKAHEHAVCYGICADASNSMKSSNPHSGIYEADTSRTLDNNCGNPACNQGGIAIVEPDK